MALAARRPRPSSLRDTPLSHAPPPRVAAPPQAATAGITDTRGWSEERIRERLDAVKIGLGCGEMPASRWWVAFERTNRQRLGLVLRLAEELAVVRKATIAEFLEAYDSSNTENIHAILYFIDYMRLKKQEEQKKKAKAERARPPRIPA